MFLQPFVHEIPAVTMRSGSLCIRCLFLLFSEFYQPEMQLLNAKKSDILAKMLMSFI